MKDFYELDNIEQDAIIDKLMRQIRRRNFELGYDPLTESEMLDAIAEVLYGVKSHRNRTSRLVYRK